MVFYAHLLQEALDSPTIVVMTDRIDLDDQLYAQFSQCADFLRQTVDLLRNTGKDTKTVGVMKKSHAKTQTKMRVRSVIGHPGRSIVTAFGVAVAAFCILTGFIMKDSLDTLMHGGLTSSIKYEYLYRLNSLEEGTR